MNRAAMAAFRHTMGPLALLALLCAAPSGAAAQEGGWRFWTGRDLLKSCQASLSGRVACTSYIAGVVDNHETMAASGYGRRMYCPPAAAKVAGPGR